MARKLTKQEEEILDAFKNRRKGFSDYLNEYYENDNIFTCPSCGYPTLTERNGYEICDICFWEDEGADDGNGEYDEDGGPNHDLSLIDSRLIIGKELNKLAEELRGEIITNPIKFFKIFEDHKNRMNNIRKGSSWEEWRKTRDLIKKDLIEINK